MEKSLAIIMCADAPWKNPPNTELQNSFSDIELSGSCLDIDAIDVLELDQNGIAPDLATDAGSGIRWIV